MGAGATHFDYLRLFRAIECLCKMGFLSTCTEEPEENYSDCSQTRALKAYKVSNVLVRKVASPMLLEAQRKVVKRQALIDRVLSNELPHALAVRAKEQLNSHIPWYYEDILLRPFEGRGTSNSTVKVE